MPIPRVPLSEFKLKDRKTFTVDYKRRAYTLILPIKISEACEPRPVEELPKTIPVENAILDTGATCSCISKRIVDELGLSKIDVTLNHTANGEREANVYLINMYLPNEVFFSGLRVIDANLLDTDVLIGMDVIGNGDFAITHKNGTTKVSFLCPPYEDIDFVTKVEKARHQSSMKQQYGKKKPKRKSG